MTRHSRKHQAGWVALVMAAVAGCGGDGGAPPKVRVYEVKGKVLLGDGKPLTAGRVFFVPTEGLMSSVGKIEPDGGFSLVTGNSGEGAAPGNYKVRVEPEDASLLPGARAPAKGKKLPFAQKYLDEDASGLTATVKAEPNQLEPFRLK